jgi:hypothetical protein
MTSRSASPIRSAGGTLFRRASQGWLGARITYQEGQPDRATSMLEDSIRVLSRDSAKLPWVLAMPLVTAAEWRLARGDPGGADSLARLAVAAAAVDSLARTRSAYAGRAEVVLARAGLALGNRSAAREALDQAVIALSTGLGPENAQTRNARAFRDSLARRP